MAASSASVRRDVWATGFRYFARNPPPEVLRNDVRVFGESKGISAEEYKRRRLSVTEAHEVPILDARAAEGGLGSWELDKHGFQVFQAPQPFPNFRDTADVMSHYYPKIIEVAKALTGAKTGIPLSKSGGYLLRTESPKSLTEAYSAFAHTDVGPDSLPDWRGMLKKRGVPPEEADTCDICMYNVWHPIDRPAYKNTLCLLDASNQDGSRAVECVRYKYELSAEIRSANGEQAYSKASTESQATSQGPLFAPSHRWVYIPDQKPEEVWLFKQFDTRDGVARCTFHNSFYDPMHEGKLTETHGRRSAEFRFILIFPKAKDSASKL